MEIIKFGDNLTVEDAVEKDEPLCAVISHDSSKAYIAHLDEVGEHHILLRKVGFTGTEIDRYFRIIFNRSGADWTFVCPPDYKNISDKTRRIGTFYKDGFAAISKFLAEMGYLIDITIPKRYSRHFITMYNGTKEGEGN